MEDAEPSAPEALVLRAWGTVIRRYRLWKRLSRRELAARAGISPVFLGEIERGEKDPSSHSLCRIAGALDAPLAELYLRVATELGVPGSRGSDPQHALPLAVSESGNEYLEGVTPAMDETAYDLYRIARQLRSDQQVAMLLLAKTFTQGEG